jgi:hypothetical protein
VIGRSGTWRAADRNALEKGVCEMTNVIEVIRKRFQQSGWSVRDGKLETLAGGMLWMVSARRKSQVFSAQGETQREAWKSAWHLAKQLHVTAGRPPMIVSFPGRHAAYRRAG